jgi:hypothetical protein
MDKSSDLIGNGTRDLAACSMVPPVVSSYSLEHIYVRVYLLMLH